MSCLREHPKDHQPLALAPYISKRVSSFAPCTGHTSHPFLEHLNCVSPCRRRLRLHGRRRSSRRRLAGCCAASGGLRAGGSAGRWQARLLEQPRERRCWQHVSLRCARQLRRLLRGACGRSELRRRAPAAAPAVRRKAAALRARCSGRTAVPYGGCCCCYRSSVRSLQMGRVAVVRAAHRRWRQIRDTGHVCYNIRVRAPRTA